ncbi:MULTISPECIES: bifunctional diaminohydroxyphosphoribosylaminopyrimidine deaminase/5-amino-6-(5-phosphoribosylamino)uracil reductase RibD [unclassified Haematobacter]|uniref:bifunctional diaminohydroxyphosphoribosylaminopyrimidine deaminase/5-amino-6-(5-phosphoribosylamino)uracil reductase RibD n=1 Tax=unclassified Haematobacter TaxID=2640585 RepID=UPI0025C6CCAA|nr:MULTISPECIES: bifunctional diaminohydroxyphosphoribosylaminopyrimidine deaminase/5-amino-6-(5-phosphoribosylamino)uracil reductase RibD [unclassified Haematobacter]
MKRLSDSDARYLTMAIALGERGWGCVWPNPAVGCVIVRDGRIVGRGWTQPGGRPHAEIMALRDAGDAARGATAYVSLEPCSHHGKTPPCAEALIAAGIARVVSALEDPDPRVAGRGHRMLAEAGLAVFANALPDMAERSHRGFLSRVRKGRPMLTLKLATTLDGRIATATGESRWITGAEARRYVHLMRARHDAVLIGGGTARADDPGLTVRDLGDVPSPVRVVAAAALDLPVDGQLARTAAEGPPVWLLFDAARAPAAARRFWEKAGARLLPVSPDATGGLDARAMLAALGAQGLTRVFCEGGGMLAASLLRAAVVDDLAMFTAGRAIGADGHAAVGPLLLDRLADAPRFSLRESRAIGADMLTQWEAV